MWWYGIYIGLMMASVLYEVVWYIYILYPLIVYYIAVGTVVGPTQVLQAFSYACANNKVGKGKATTPKTAMKKRAALGGIQTHDTLQSRRMLYQLSYQGNLYIQHTLQVAMEIKN